MSNASGFRTASENRDARLVTGELEHGLSDDVSARVECCYSDLGHPRSGFDRLYALFGLRYRF